MRRIVVDLSASPYADVQMADALAGLADDAARRDAELWLVAVRAPARETLDRAGAGPRGGRRLDRRRAGRFTSFG